MESDNDLDTQAGIMFRHFKERAEERAAAAARDEIALSVVEVYSKKLSASHADNARLSEKLREVQVALEESGRVHKRAEEALETDRRTMKNLFRAERERADVLDRELTATRLEISRLMKSHVELVSRQETLMSEMGDLNQDVRVLHTRMLDAQLLDCEDVLEIDRHARHKPGKERQQLQRTLNRQRRERNVSETAEPPRKRKRQELTEPSNPPSRAPGKIVSKTVPLPQYNRNRALAQTSNLDTAIDATATAEKPSRLGKKSKPIKREQLNGFMDAIHTTESESSSESICDGIWTKHI